MLLSGTGTFTSGPIPANAHTLKFPCPLKRKLKLIPPFGDILALTTQVSVPSSYLLTKGQPACTD